MVRYLAASTAMMGLLLSVARANVFNMPSGMTSLEMVPVGNPGNGNDSETGYGSVADPYLIGKCEVTAGQYTEFLNAVADNDTYGLYSSNMWSDTYGCKIQQSGSSPNYTYSVAGDRADRPVNFVSWGDAVRFCNWLHNGQPSGPQGDGTTEDGAYDLNGATTFADLMAVARQSDATWFIPTENQWYKAAYHKNDGVTANYWDYPMQTDDPNVLSNDLINPDPGKNANFRVYPDDYTTGGPYWTTEVGEFENSESGYNTFDQGGNLWEWTEATVRSRWRGMRGGVWDSNRDWLRSGNNGVDDPTNEGYYAGFRVASVPEPSTLALLALGVVGLLIGLRR